MKTENLHANLTHRIIGCAFRVHNNLGPGLPEQIYKKSLAIAFRKSGIRFIREAPLRVLYEGEFAGEVFADFLCEGEVLVEAKAVKALDEAHEAQLRGYQIIGRKPVGLLLNFGWIKVEVSRRIRSEFAA